VFFFVLAEAGTRSLGVLAGRVHPEDGLSAVAWPAAAARGHYEYKYSVLLSRFHGHVDDGAVDDKRKERLERTTTGKRDTAVSAFPIEKVWIILQRICPVSNTAYF
jgi:hypothetical protein